MSKEAVLDGVEKVIDAVDETAETLERIPKVNLNGTTKGQGVAILLVTAVASAAVGAGVTYWLTNKKLEAKYEKLAAEDVAEAKRFYATLNKDVDPEELAKHYEDQETQNDFAADDTVIEEAATAMSQYMPDESQERPKDDETVEVERVVAVEKNVFVEKGESRHPNYETERDQRRNGDTYVITKEEWFENPDDHSQQTLTYYAGDQVLADLDDVPVMDNDKVVGKGNLKRFGQWSEDPNVVYIRNEQNEADYEVLYSEGSFAHEVLALETELKHSDDYAGKTPRFRQEE